MPYPNEHAARLKDPDQFVRVRRENDKFGEGIDVIWGIKEEDGEEHTDIQAIRFDKDKFTPTQAKEWLAENDHEPIEFEEAEETTENAMKTNAYQRVTVNFDRPNVRREQMEGKDWIVVPVVILTEGVHAGSNGPLYYPPDELEKSIPAWDSKPVVVYHPVRNGQPVSAANPETFTKRKIGILMGTKYEGSRLKSEAWLDEEKTREVDNRVLDAINALQVMEVSTGLFPDVDPESGVWNDEVYSGIARNHRPDHLAVLPDLVGACSVADGAGLMVNASSVANFRSKKSLTDIQRQVDALLNPPTTDTAMGKYRWIEDHFDGFVIYGDNEKLFEQEYEVKKGEAGETEVELKGAPQEVFRVTEYRSADGKLIANIGKEKYVAKEKDVQALIKNEKSPWTEEDKEFLMGMTDEQLQKASLAANAEDDKEPEEEEETEEERKEREAKEAAAKKKKEEEEEPTENKAPQKPLTMQEYVENAPAEYRDVLVHGVKTHNAQKQALIAAILANEANKFTKEHLAGKGMEELEAIAALAHREKSKVDWTGMGDATPPVSNEEGLPLPTLKFSKTG